MDLFFTVLLINIDIQEQSHNNIIVTCISKWFVILNKTFHVHILALISMKFSKQNVKKVIIIIKSRIIDSQCKIKFSRITNIRRLSVVRSLKRLLSIYIYDFDLIRIGFFENKWVLCRHSKMNWTFENNDTRVRNGR